MRLILNEDDVYCQALLQVQDSDLMNPQVE